MEAVSIGLSPNMILGTAGSLLVSKDRNATAKHRGSGIGLSSPTLVYMVILNAAEQELRWKDKSVCLSTYI